MMSIVHQLKKDKIAMIGAVIILFLAGIAILAPYITPYDPIELDLENRLSSSDGNHLMGTDNLGRDVLSRIIYGARISLSMATVVVVIVMLLGTAMGTIAGYFGGIIDGTIMRVVDVLLAFPNIILALVIAGILGPSLTNVMIALSAIWWVGYARIIRGSVLSVKEKEFVEAARAMGCSDTHIAIRHILPNVLSPVIVLATLDMGHIILSIAALSFLGLGAQPPIPEWGTMLNEGRPFMETAPHLMIFPGLMIMVVVLAFNFLGDGLRDALDPRMKEVMMK
ncbi:MAG TPA: nickel ABC transporter permease subunit NikC [Methanophagales archaeon]|nr:nickel ABC transporter permease subunit NikC [Methanophagales archaeon]